MAMRQHPISSFKSKGLTQSLFFAFEGLRSVLKTERNFRTHILMAISVTCAGFFFQISTLEWVLLILCMTLMMAVEVLNTAIEVLADAFSEGQYSEHSKRVKDISAGACLLIASGVAIAGTLIFLPYLLAFLNIPETN